MAVLRPTLVFVACLTGCYSPSLRDCVVTCTSTADCAPSQVCGSDGMCAGPELAGRCGHADAGGADAPRPPTDAAPDAPRPPDAPSPVALIVQIAGHGSVTVTGIGACSDTAPGHQCTFSVTPGVTLQLIADGGETGQFDKWTSAACTGQDATCTLTPTAPTTTVAAKFAH